MGRALALAVGSGALHAAWSVGVTELVLFAAFRTRSTRARVGLIACLWLFGLALPVLSLSWTFKLLNLRAYPLIGGDARGLAGIVYGLALFIYLLRLLPRLGRSGERERL